jgi:hypothetical protein
VLAAARNESHARPGLPFVEELDQLGVHPSMPCWLATTDASARHPACQALSAYGPGGRRVELPGGCCFLQRTTGAPLVCVQLPLQARRLQKLHAGASGAPGMLQDASCRTLRQQPFINRCRRTEQGSIFIPSESCRTSRHPNVAATSLQGHRCQLERSMVSVSCWRSTAATSALVIWVPMRTSRLTSRARENGLLLCIAATAL